MKIRTQTHVWMCTALVNLIGLAIVLPTIMLLYPVEKWVWELSLSTTLTVIIATPVSYFMAGQLKKNRELSDALIRLVERDRLTDVATRDYFYSRMEAMPEAYGTPLMIDIDHFKEVNDTYGHLAGDQVIQEVANIVQENVRDGDIVARFGGEEFLVFLFDRSPRDGFKVAERIRIAIQQHIVKFDANEVEVTVSVGVAQKETDAEIEASIKAADDALYEAKRSGRNRTVFNKTNLSENKALAKAS